MAGAVVGALLALALSVLVTSSASDDAAQAARNGVRMKASYDAPAGSCLIWDKGTGENMRRIACEQEHLFEVTEILDISKDFPPDAAAPGAEYWRKIATDRCTEGAADYLGEPLDPHGKLQVSALKPSDADWAAGNRELRCGLWWAAPGGELQETSGPAALADQSLIWPAGTCLALAGKTVGDPIGCAQPHAYEMIAVVDLSDEFGKKYPSQKRQHAWLDERCSDLADKYTGKLDLAKKKLILTWDTRTKESWQAGSFKVNCKVGAKLPDGSGLAPVTGSIEKS